jgi:hypothetical protein
MFSNMTVKANRVWGKGVLAGILLVPQVCLGIDADSLADICKSMEESIVDISATYEWDQDPPMRPDEIVGKELLIMKGAEKHSLMAERPFMESFVYTFRSTVMDERGRYHEELLQSSYRGGVARNFQESVFPADGNSPVRKQLVASIRPRRPGRLPIFRTPLGFSVLRFSYEADGAGVLSERLRQKDLVVVSDTFETVNGFRTIRADLLITEIKQPYAKIHFAVDHGYAPIRYTYMRGPGMIGFTVDVNSLQKCGNGLWFPASGTVRSTDRARVDRWRATEPIVLNRGLEDKDFDVVRFPPGTAVSDEITGREYIVKPTQGQLDEVLPVKN